MSNLVTLLSSDTGTPSPEELSTAVKAYSAAVFLFTWILILPSEWAWFPLGRPGSGLVGAALMMVGGIVSFNHAMLVIGDSLEVLCLLFGLFIIANFLAKEGVYEYMEIVFTYKCSNAFDFTFRVVFFCGILSALITNDAVCIFITPLVVRICHQRGIPFGPLLLALGTSSNIGSAATITGNPQNALIALYGGIGFVEFAMYMVPVAIVGLAINCFFICLQFNRDLRNRSMKPSIFSSLEKPLLANYNEDHNENYRGDEEVGPQNIQGESPMSPDLLESSGLTPLAPENDTDKAKNEATKFRQRMNLVAKIATILCTLGCFSAFFVGIPIGQASLTGAVAIIAVQGLFRHHNPKEELLQVDWMLMIFFSGLFITVEGCVATGYPELITDWIFSGVDLVSQVGCVLYVIVITAASNMLSNVPAVLLIKPFVNSLPENLRFAYWVIAAWVSTVGGNLTIIGSAANIIVAERAKATGYYEMSFMYFFKYGAWSTVIIVTLGTMPLYFFLLG